MTGESHVIKKDDQRPFMVSGTVISEGNAEMMVTAVGWNSAWGILYKDLQKPPEVIFYYYCIFFYKKTQISPIFFSANSHARKS